ncbi:MAG: Rne/Rng family ribonuclease, partial [Alphaproteobacteria bacterium]
MIDEILCSVGPGEIRVALMEGGRLVEFAVERAAERDIVGNIYLGRVQSVVPSINAAFVDIAIGRDGFLPLEGRRRGQAPDAATGAPQVNEGAAILVQVDKAAQGDKGAALTLAPTLAGHALVFVPGGEGVNISRRIGDETARNRIAATVEAVVAEMMAADHTIAGGYIVRTAAMETDQAAFAAEARELAAKWENIQARVKLAEAPALVHAEPDLFTRVLRDHGGDAIRRIKADDTAPIAQAQDHFHGAATAPMIEHYMGEEPLFESAGVEDELETALGPRVSLPGGGAIVIEATEALCAIDVNSARHGGGNPDGVALEVNLEAAKEIARQVRLRNIAGLIVIDFIHMKDAGHLDRVHGELATALNGDAALARLGGFTELGLVELARRRRGVPLAQLFMVTCEACEGEGLEPAPGAVAYHALAELAREATHHPGANATVVAVPEVTAVLRADAAGAVDALANTIGAKVTFKDAPERAIDDFD